MNIQDWSPLGWTDWNSLQSKGLSRVSVNSRSWWWTGRPGVLRFMGSQIAGHNWATDLIWSDSSKASFLQCSPFFIVQPLHSYITSEKTIALTRWDTVGKGMSLLFNMLSRLVIIFLPRSNCLFVSWLCAPSTVILESKKIVCLCFHHFTIYLPWSDGTGWHDLHILNVEF